MDATWQRDPQIGHIEHGPNRRIRCIRHAPNVEADAKDWQVFMRAHAGCQSIALMGFVEMAKGDTARPKVEPPAAMVFPSEEPYPSDAKCDAVAEAVLRTIDSTTSGMFIPSAKHDPLAWEWLRTKSRAAIREALAKGGV